MCKILVTGANGYLGKGIVTKLIDRGASVVATDVCVEDVDNRAVKKSCNLFSIEDPYEFFEKPDVVLHLAWRDGFVHYSNAHIDDLANHYSFLTKMMESKINRIAVMGSMHEIGFYEGSINEYTPCNPITPYGISKNALRCLVEMKASQCQIDYQWLRGFYIVSNSPKGSSIFSKIAAAAEEGKRVFPFTTGQSQYDFMNYEDFCKYVAVTVMQNRITGIINICSGRPEKLADRVERFIEENEYDIALKYGEFPDRPYDSKAIWGNSEKIERIMSEES